MAFQERYERIKATLSRRQPDLTVAMENVHKTRNLGALARTCDAVGIGEINAIAPPGDPINFGHKTAAGVKKWISVRRHDSTDAAFAALRSRGFRILAADLGPGTKHFRDVDYVCPTALVMGSELDGLSNDAAAAADERVHIPLVGMVESLNVSVAAGVILFEAAHQREAAGCYASRRISDEEYHRRCFEWLHPEVAHYCRQHERAYPALDEFGNLTQSVTQNARDGFGALAESRLRD